jgi:RNA polymerase-interacting CarD/CdnL/TRCF family regulator
MNAIALHIGDEVIHPRYGFGTVESLLAHDREGTPVDYYVVRLTDGGLLSVPIAGAAALGLRRLANGVAAMLAVLRGTAVPLPEHPRQRVMELSARWTSPEPAALAGGVRDLLGHARRFGLKAGEQQWLKRACERLGSEAARVDGVTPAAARAAITEEVTRLKEPPPEPPAPAKPAPARKYRSH